MAFEIDLAAWQTSIRGWGLSNRRWTTSTSCSKHPLAVAGLAGLPADAGDKLLGGEADDGRDRHRQHRRAVLAVRVVTAARRSGSEAGRRAPRRRPRRRAGGASGCRARCGTPGSSPARWCPSSSPRRSCAGTRRRRGRAARRGRVRAGTRLRPRVAPMASGPATRASTVESAYWPQSTCEPDRADCPGQDGRRAEGREGAYCRPQITYRVHAVPSVAVDEGLIGLDGWSSGSSLSLTRGSDR